MRPRLFLLPFVAIAALTLRPLPRPTKICWERPRVIRSVAAPIGISTSRVRVGSFSNLDHSCRTTRSKRRHPPLPLPQAPANRSIEYRFEQQNYTIEDFLARERVTGLLLIKDGQILVERYQYDRTASNRFLSHSMAKSIVSLAVGIALAEKKDQFAGRLGRQLCAEACRQSLWRNHPSQYAEDVVGRAFQRGL